VLLIATDAQGQLGPAQMKKDILELRKGLEKNHPGLYWYTSKEQFDSAWNMLDAATNKPMSDIDFFKSLLPVVAKVKCAHTLFYPSKEILSAGKRFPLALKFIGEKAFVIADSGANNIPMGAELVAINGKSMQHILKSMWPGLQAQGGNPAWKYVTLENDFQNYYFYVVEQADNFRIEYIEPGTTQKIEKELKGVTDQKLKNHWSKWYPPASGPPLSIHFTPFRDVAIITIKSLAKVRYKIYKQEFETTLAKYFQEINQTGLKGLIIDLRGNEGGNNPETVYSYIARPGDKDVSGADKDIAPSKNAFDGHTIVLMNERSISSQEIFVAIFRNNHRGLTIGRATPGSDNGLCGGNKKRIVLPNSHFEINIPLHASTWTFIGKFNHQPGQGFAPDIRVDETIEDLLSGKDVPMQVALKTIQEL
jgi:hypothetical protein